MSWLTALEVALNDLTVVERLVASTVTGLALLGVFVLARRETAQHESRLVSVSAGLMTLAALGAASAVFVVVWGVEAAAVQTIENAQIQVGLAVKAFLTVAFLAAVYVGTGFIHQMVERFVTQRNGITEHQAEVTYRIVQISVYVLALLAVLGFWEVNLAGLLIGAGFAGIVVGMAARQTLGAVIAGFVLMFARPFEIGDWVKVGDKDGIVTDITIVNTRLQTFDGEYVILPNDYVGSNEVVNRSRKGRLRIHVEVGVDYSTDVERARRVTKDAMSDVEDILKVPRPQVVLKEFGDSSMVLDLRFWIDKPSARRMWRAQTSVISTVKSAFDEAGIAIPFPQRSLSARDHGGGFRVQQPPAGANEAVDEVDSTQTATGRTANEPRGDQKRSDHEDHEPPTEDDHLESAVGRASGVGGGRDDKQTSESKDQTGESDEQRDENSEQTGESDSLESAVERVENKDD